MKKLVATLLAAILLLSVWGTAALAENSAVVGDSTYATITKLTDEDVTLKIMLAIRDTDSLVPPAELDAVKNLEALTGVKTEWEVIKGSDWSMKTSLMWTTGDYPDILIAVNGGGGVDYEEYGVSQGLVIPLNDYINADVMPNYYGRIAAEDNDPTVSLVASDGQVYSIGYLVGQNICEEGHYFINNDWLTELNLEVPETVEQLTEVLRQFKQAHPDGVPYEIAFEVPYYSAINYTMPMFGVPNSDKWIYIDNDKQVQFIPYQPGFRAALEWCHQLYEEGLLDPECLSQDSTTFNNKLAEGNVGFFSAWRISNMGFDDGVYKDCTVILPPHAEGYEALMDRYIEVARPCGFVTSSCKNPELACRFLDAMMDTEMQADLYYGMQNATIGQGWKYNEENGKIDTYTVSSETIKAQIDCNTQFFAPGKYINSTYNWSPARLEKIEYCEMYDAAGVINKYSSQYLGFCGLSADVLSEFNLLEVDIKSAISEAVADFVQHGITDSSWDSFTAKFAKMGIDNYVATYQAAIDQMNLD